MSGISQIAICNSALMKLGDLNILSMIDASKSAKLCNQFYDTTRDAVLRLHPWNCAIHRKELAASSETPAFEFSYAYPLPSDPYCLRVLSMESSDYEYVIEGRNLLTNESSCKIKYIKKITDPSLFDPLFVNVFVLKLAAVLAFPLTQSRQIVESIEIEFNNALVDARSINAMENNQQRETTSSWINSRY